jgi:hypothetical protein
VIGCNHEHYSVSGAAACISSAGGYVVAVQRGSLRPLNRKEEAAFQRAVHGSGVEIKKYTREEYKRMLQRLKSEGFA